MRGKGNCLRGTEQTKRVREGPVDAEHKRLCAGEMPSALKEFEVQNARMECSTMKAYVQGCQVIRIIFRENEIHQQTHVGSRTCHLPLRICRRLCRGQTLVVLVVIHVHCSLTPRVVSHSASKRVDWS